MQIDFNKSPDLLVPAVIQDSANGTVLMLGYMNNEAFEKTKAEKKVTFYSRSKKRLWTKGEESGNFLLVDEIKIDCDNDTLLIKARPTGPVCHTGAKTCFDLSPNPSPSGEGSKFGSFSLAELERIINDRKNNPTKKSYTASLFAKGINKIAQKVGEEATELIIEAKDNNDDLFKNEAADLLYHYLILLSAKNITLKDIEKVLEERHEK